MKRSLGRIDSGMNRRAFFGSTAGLIASVALPLSSTAVALEGADSEFVVVNGWVLTRADLAGARKANA
jgi:hypothetical protein